MEKTEVLIGYQLRRDRVGGVLFLGVTPAEIASAFQNELESEEAGFDDRDTFTIEPVEITQEQIDNMPEFEGW